MKLFIKPRDLHIAWNATVKEGKAHSYMIVLILLMPETCVSTSFANSIFAGSELSFIIFLWDETQQRIAPLQSPFELQISNKSGSQFP